MEADKKFEKFLLTDDLVGTEWLGLVVDNVDPEKEGRCRVRVFGKFDGRIKPDDDTSAYAIPDSDLPWAYPTGSSVFGGGAKHGAGSFSAPKKGAKVKVRFSGGNIYEPEYYAVQDLNEAMMHDINDSYENAHVVAYDQDEDLKIIYTKNEGMTIYLKKSLININSGTIKIVNEKGDAVSVGDGGIQITTDGAIDIVAGSNKVSVDDSGVNVKGTSVFINGQNQVLFAKNPQSVAIVDVAEIGVSQTVKVG